MSSATFAESSTLASEFLTISSTIFLISLADLLDWSERLPISVATTANPLPAYPALAASIEALSASRLVWLAMDAIISTASLIFCTASFVEEICLDIS